MKNVLALFLISLLFYHGFIAVPEAGASDTHARQRAQMVARQIAARGISDQRVLRAMGAVERHRFVPGRLAFRAYADTPLPIGGGQTISQPYIVALMSESLSLTGNERVLEIGTGSGYQAAVLAKLAGEVTTVEIRRKLHRKAKSLFASLGIDNVTALPGDGYFGWRAAAPYDGIMITAAVDHIPPPLLDQLKEGGRLVLPLGNPFSYQNLVLVTKRGDDYTVRQITGVLFVPMTGNALDRKEKAP